MANGFSLRSLTDLAAFWDKADARFFVDHPDRKARIRHPYNNECHGEFWSLGEHQRDRRRIIAVRVDHEGNPLPKNQIMKIPFLAFADESIEDSDTVLMPIVREIMAVAFQKEKWR